MFLGKKKMKTLDFKPNPGPVLGKFYQNFDRSEKKWLGLMGNNYRRLKWTRAFESV